MRMKNGQKPFEKKYIRISSKRQITIPQKYYDALGFEDQAECILNDSAIVIRPVRENVGIDFSEQVLADLVSEGYSGDELVKMFSKKNSEIKDAWDKMLSEADSIANGKGEYYTLDDVFPEE